MPHRYEAGRTCRLRRPLVLLAVTAAAVSLGASLALVPAAAGAGRSGWVVRALPLRAAAPYSFSEPGIAAGPGGLLVANACTANANLPSTFWRSRDGGFHWSTGFPIGSSAIGCGDSDVALGPDGYEYALTLGTGVDVYRSQDGRHWSGPASMPPPHGADQPDRPWLAVDPQRPAVVYLFNSEIGGNIVEWTSTDHAATFSGPVPVTGGINSEAALTLGSRPLVDPRRPGHLMLFFETASFAGLANAIEAREPDEFPLSQLWEATSTDGGQHWTSQLVLDVGTTFGATTGTLGHLLPATAIDEHGTPYVAISVRLDRQSATHVYLTHALGGGKWAAPVRVDRGTGSNVMPALAVSPSGAAYLSWYASRSPDCAGASTRWEELVATAAPASAGVPRWSVTRLSGTDPVHVGPIENMGAVGFDLRENWALRDFQSITLDSGGLPHVAWAADFRTPRTYVAMPVR